jgi:septal ring factor EnvC (AmiA/AmiB activator)
MRSRLLYAAMCVAMLATLPGCIVRDIHKELVEANARVAAVEQELQRIKRTNTLLDALQQERLNILDSMQTTLVALQERLETMDSIDESLKKLDRHLASLRKTIDNIDSTIPFLKIGDDKSVEEDEAEIEEEQSRQDKNAGETGGGGLPPSEPRQPGSEEPG